MEKKIAWVALPCGHKAPEPHILEITCQVCRKKFQRVGVIWRERPRVVPQQTVKVR